jgi:hypothetical protein
MPSPVLAPDFSIPRRSDIDSKLVLGAAIFGVGWGLGGFCPGPALTSLASGAPAVAIFVAAMALGMYIHSWVSEIRAAAPAFAGAPSEGMQDA